MLDMEHVGTKTSDLANLVGDGKQLAHRLAESRAGKRNNFDRRIEQRTIFLRFTAWQQ